MGRCSSRPSGSVHMCSIRRQHEAAPRNRKIENCTPNCTPTIPIPAPPLHAHIIKAPLQDGPYNFGWEVGPPGWEGGWPTTLAYMGGSPGPLFAALLPVRRRCRGAVACVARPAPPLPRCTASHREHPKCATPRSSTVARACPPPPDAAGCTGPSGASGGGSHHQCEAGVGGGAHAHVTACVWCVVIGGWSGIFFWGGGGGHRAHATRPGIRVCAQACLHSSSLALPPPRSHTFLPPFYRRP